MPTAPGDAFLEPVTKEEIARLAGLYDRFAHALDPFSPESDEAERVFAHQVADMYDYLRIKGISLHDFRKAVILRCKQHLQAADKPSTV
jgi:hypothetical protein